MDWSHFNPVAIHVGAGALDAASDHLPPGRALLLTTPGMRARGTVARIVKRLPANLPCEVCSEVAPNPELDGLEALRERYATAGFSSIIALGGGSAIDSAKVLAVLLAADPGFSLRACLEGRQTMPAATPLPVIAIPTTAGTGSEVTPFATVWAAREGRKFSLAGSRMFPRAALLDPELTRDLPRDVTVASGLDALSQALESTWNRHATPITLSIALRSAALAHTALQHVAATGPSAADRADLMEASLLAGLGISQTRTALAHSMSYPITARFGLPHGLACSFMLPALLRYNAVADDGRLRRVAQALGMADTEALASALTRLLHSLEVPARVRAHVPDYDALMPLIPEMFTKGRSDNNLRAADAVDVAQILRDTRLALAL